MSVQTNTSQPDKIFVRGVTVHFTYTAGYSMGDVQTVCYTSTEKYKRTSGFGEYS